MKLGIVGLPNVGKSTLFNAITSTKNAAAANYPFCTIDPNTGVVPVPDARLDKLAEIWDTNKKTPAIVEFVDIAGLVKGASKGEGLGNKFLGNIRECDAIVHVVRCFDDDNIIHVVEDVSKAEAVDPISDIDAIDYELILSDLEVVQNRAGRMAKAAKSGNNKGAAAEAAWNPADVTEPLDRAAMAKLALVVRQATEALESYEHSKALEVIESYFWQFCDDYIELVKNRAYGTPDEHGNVPSEKAVKSARTALGLGLDAFARLLAPYLPYATEEVWSWMHAGSGSVHRAAWPVVDPYVEAATGASPELLTWAGKAVEQLRKIKSEAKVSMKTPILSVALSAASEGVEAIHAALGDIAQAGRVVGKFDLVAKHAEESAAEGTPETEVAVEASELGEPPAKKPKH
mgnify:CR=1 FL=1